MLDTTVSLIPGDSVIFRVIADLREWAAAHGDDWRATLRLLHGKYGYDKFGGGCHMVPNHAVVLLGLLHGGDDFQRAMMITNTAGYDTDCNAGNVGCILGAKNGLAGIDAGPDWRGPVADRLYLSAADGGRCITDALRETYEIVNAGRALAGHGPVRPKGGARFHFTLPGSVQGFGAEESAEVRGTVTMQHDAGRLALRLHGLAPGRAARAATATFTPPDALGMPHYTMVTSPTLYSGQTVTASLLAGPDLSGPVTVSLYARVYDMDDKLTLVRGPQSVLSPGSGLPLEWTTPDTGGYPIAEIGIEARAEHLTAGTLYLDSLTWAGPPSVKFQRPKEGGSTWQRAWVNATGEAHFGGASADRYFSLADNTQTGLALIGEWSWSDYTVSTEVFPRLCRRAGLVAGVRGLRRYVALVLDEDRRVRLIQEQDGERRILAEFQAAWTYESPYPLALSIRAGHVSGRFGEETLEAALPDWDGAGAVGLLIDKGIAEFGPVTVSPL